MESLLAKLLEKTLAEAGIVVGEEDIICRLVMMVVIVTIQKVGFCVGISLRGVFSTVLKEGTVGRNISFRFAFIFGKLVLNPWVILGNE